MLYSVKHDKSLGIHDTAKPERAVEWGEKPRE